MKHLCFILLMGLVACEPKEHRPTGLIDDAAMAQLLADMHILETAQNSKTLQSDSIQFSYEQIYTETFKKHNVTRSQYDSTMMWLSHHPAELEVVYDQVISELSERESRAKQ